MNPSVYMCTGHELSPHNAIWAIRQMPHCTILGGANQWAQRGRYIRKGEKAIRIFAPRVKDDGTVRFPNVPVFDISQTEECEPERREAWIAQAKAKAEKRRK